jgi:hypothetical protein
MTATEHTPRLRRHVLAIVSIAWLLLGLFALDVHYRTPHTTIGAVALVVPAFVPGALSEALGIDRFTNGVLWDPCTARGF